MNLKQAKMITVGPVRYTVALKYHDDTKEGQTILGVADLMNARIELNRDQSDDMKTVSFFHELFHIILYQAGRKEHDNEPLMNALAHGMADFLGNNWYILADMLTGSGDDE